MSRTVNRTLYYCDKVKIERTIADYMRAKGYRLRKVDGEKIWKKGLGLFSPMRCIEVKITKMEVITYAWIRMNRDDELDLNSKQIPTMHKCEMRILIEKLTHLILWQR